MSSYLSQMRNRFSGSPYGSRYGHGHGPRHGSRHGYGQGQGQGYNPYSRIEMYQYMKPKLYALLGPGMMTNHSSSLENLKSFFSSISENFLDLYESFKESGFPLMIFLVIFGLLLYYGLRYFIYFKVDNFTDKRKHKQNKQNKKKKNKKISK